MLLKRQRCIVNILILTISIVFFKTKRTQLKKVINTKRSQFKYNTLSNP